MASDQKIVAEGVKLYCSSISPINVIKMEKKDTQTREELRNFKYIAN